MEEQWKEIKKSGYFASDQGRIKNKRDKILKGSDRGNGYLSVHINLGDGCKHYSIHRLILETFEPISNEELYHVDHIDKNKQNNKLKNLRWVSAKENNILRNDPKKEMNFIINNDIYTILNQIVQLKGEKQTLEILNSILNQG